MKQGSGYLDDIAAIFRRNDVDEVPPSRRKVHIGAGRRHGERVCREFGGIALEEIVDIRPAAQKDAAQNKGLHRCRMRDGVGQARVLPQLPPKTCILPSMCSSWRSADTSSIRCWVVLSVSAGVASSSLALGVLLPQPRWSKSTTRYRCGLKKRADELWLPAPWPAMHDDDRLAGRRAVFLPIDPMLGKSGRRQMTGPDERWVHRLVV